MIPTFRLALLFVTSIAMVSAAAEFPRPTVGYSGDLVMKIGSGDEMMEMSGKLWGRPDRERFEGGPGGMKTISINRYDRNVTWVLFPAQKAYIEQPIGGEGDPGTRPGGDVELEKIGDETIGGLETTKYRVSTNVQESGTHEGHVWLTAEKIPVRMVGKIATEGETTPYQSELRNLKVGDPDSSLFEVPAGYSKAVVPTMPQGMENMTPEDASRLAEEMQKQMQEMMRQMGQPPAE